MTIAESIQLNKEQIARAFGVPARMLADPDRTAVPRYWSLCMTSENHGTVGPAGCTFSHAPEKHERVLVVEVPAAAGAPVDQVRLQLVTSAGGQADVDRALRAAQAWMNEEYMCGLRMGKGEPAMSDRADTAKTECIAAILALAAPAAAQAGQVAVPPPVWRGIKAVLTNLIAVASIRITDKDEDDDQLIDDATEAVRQLDAAVQASTPGEPKCTCPSGDGSLRRPCTVHPPAAHASISGERQEGGSRG